MNPSVYRRPSECLLVAAAFFLTLFFFGPTWIFFHNANEFYFGSGSVLLVFATLAVSGVVLAGLVLQALPESVSVRILAMMLAAALLLWLQGNILVWNYGLLDGRDIAWEKKVYLSMIDSPIWLAVLGLALFRPRFFARLARPLSLALLTVQLLTFLTTAVSKVEHISQKHFGIDHSREFAFSSSRNIIITVLDTFPTDVFQELLSENDEYKNDFAAFTYFRNALGGSPTTCTAIPMILTAKAYENKIPMHEFLKDAYTSASLPLYLKRAGYRCDIFSWTKQGIYLDKSLASNLSDRNPPSKWEMAFLLDLSLFRQTPYFIKKMIYNQQNWFLSHFFEKPLPKIQKFIKARKRRSAKLKDRQFGKIMANEIRVDSGQPVFKFFHLRGVHPPLSKYVSGRFTRREFTRHNLKLQARGEIRRIVRFLSELKHVGAFQNSLILIVGDHGPGNWGIWDIGNCLPGMETRAGAANTALQKIKASALPLMLVKPMGMKDNQPLAISDAPVCLGDIPITAASAAGLKTDFPGRPLLTVSLHEERSRRFLHYEGFAANNRGYLNPISEYWVRGFSWFDKSWQASGRVYSPWKK